LRVRLTLSFASVVALVLAVTGGLIFVEFRRDFDKRTDAELADRQRAIVALAGTSRTPAAILALSGERLAQVYDRRGMLVASSRRLGSEPVLRAGEPARALHGAVVLTRAVPGTDDGARLRAFAISDRRVVVIGESRHERERALHRLAALLMLTLPGALLLASLAGYQVARGALAPVERMRIRAGSIAHGDLSQRLPEPGTRDELDRLAITLNDLLGRLGAALERERRIVADASHELRTPISVLRTRIDVALRGEQELPRLREALEGAGEDAARLSRLADDLLVLARADPGQLALHREPLDVQDLLEQAVDRHAHASADAGRTIEAVNDIDGGAVVLADAGRVAQALDNLIVNALRYGAGAIEIHASLHGSTAVALSVRDHGEGFPAEFLPRAFERFSQADSSHAGAGSGLGLAIVEAIAHAHGGTATAGNDADGGAVTAIILPLA
jgi:signal transduction histidine kinase